MIVWFWSVVIGALFRLRYRMRVIGLKKSRARGRTGILFLPNHPALVDPIIMETILARTFHVQALADADQMDKFFIRYLGRHFNVRLIPDATKIGVAAKAEIDAAVAGIIADLAAGANILLYPSGRVYRQRFEDLGGASAVPTILQALPDLRVVLIRTTGLWGSGFSWASGHAPDLAGLLRKGLLGLLTSGLFFAPRRKLRFEFVEPADLPRTATPSDLRRYLEAFYNADAPPNTFVPYSIWAGFKPRVLPEPAKAAITGDLAAVSDEVRRAVVAYLREITGQESFKDSDSRGRDLGLDRVGDVMLAAAGLAVPAAAAPLKPVDPGWFRDGNDPVIPPVPTVVEAFLDQVARDPNHVVLADQTAGTRTLRGIATAAAVLKKHIAPLAGDRVGILLPASVGADVVYIATLLAGKTPVMVNWTVGSRNVLHGLDLAGVKHVLTSRLLVELLSQRGSDFAGIADRLVYLEDVRGRITLGQKLSAALTARFAPQSLAPKTIPDTIAILFTSGSESLPKAVPLTSTNVLTNLSDVLKRIELRRTDRLIGFLPPFHSFGLSTGMLVPLCMNLPVVHHTDPTQGPMLARLIEAYKVTVVLGTPTFLAGILRAAAPGQLASLRLAVTGAEKCPPTVYAAFSAACPGARVVEGYGITECSPIVSFSDYDTPQPGTIGKPLPSIEYALV
ncbi:MAG: AMP-binding protein, partial [Planctomycetota bacterium]|nr:AMP-binding protein [Planctomycetota bacterium]